MDERLKEATRSEWRALGFFYDRDDAQKEWTLIGSRAGLLAVNADRHAVAPNG